MFRSQRGGHVSAKRWQGTSVNSVDRERLSLVLGCQSAIVSLPFGQEFCIMLPLTIGSDLNINDLHNEARLGGQAAEDRLFKHLSERFSLFVHRRVWNEQDGGDVVQEALMTIAREYRKMEYTVSFSAWAYKVLDNKILSYIKKKKLTGVRESAMNDDDIAQRLAAVSDTSLRSQLLGCLKKLNEVNQRHARVLNLKYQGFSTEEICSKVRVSRNAFYIVLHRARAALEACLNTGDVKG